MKVIWNPAVTLDGFIARKDGDTDWITEEEGDACRQLIRQCGCAIVGRKTYELDTDFFLPVSSDTVFIWTTRPESSELHQGIEYVSGNPAEIIAHIENKGFASTVLIGGGKTNSAFAAAGLIDEIIANIYPLTFGEGIKLLDGPATRLDLELINSKPLGQGVMRHHYRVRKTAP